MFRHHWLLYVPVGLVLGVAVACSSSSSAPSTSDTYTGSCNIIASRCHPIKTPLGKECHELGHDRDDAKCGPRKAECLAECPETVEDGGHSDPVDSGTADAAAAGDAASEAAPDGGGACTAYCACMTATCASESSYPFADEAACLSACAAFSDANRTCYAASCEDAKTAADKEHDCEHASGTVACH
ncbi:MAG TPA: hypothetical protein VM925_22705 [Labilithrix sp.]|jgi:hypothetical protein|nr:hypothetical protein [Labilithrix sp.]